MRFTRLATVAVLAALCSAPVHGLPVQNQTSTTTTSDDGSGSYVVTDPSHAHVSGWTASCGSFSRWDLLDQYLPPCTLDYCAQLYFASVPSCTNYDSGLTPAQVAQCCSDKTDTLVECLNMKRGC